jgi:hypothetical protein
MIHPTNLAQVVTRAGLSFGCAVVSTLVFALLTTDCSSGDSRQSAVVQKPKMDAGLKVNPLFTPMDNQVAPTAQASLPTTASAAAAGSEDAGAAVSEPDDADAGHDAARDAAAVGPCEPGHWSYSLIGTTNDPCPQNVPQCPASMYVAVSNCALDGSWSLQCQCLSKTAPQLPITRWPNDAAVSERCTPGTSSAMLIGTAQDPCPQEAAICPIPYTAASACDPSGTWSMQCSCVAKAALDRCGNGTVEPDEECDGSKLGTATCASLGFRTGTLRCDPVICKFDSSGCSR